MHKNFYNKVSIVDGNFLSYEKCNQILNKINSLQEYWQSKENFPYLQFLPFPLYTITNHELYVNNVKLYKDLMCENFKDLYILLQSKLSNILGLELLFHNDLNYPGFHISNGKPMEIPNFHKDGFFQLDNILVGADKFFFTKKILSIVVPLTLTSKDDGLLYRNKDLPEIKRHSLLYSDFLPYNQGMLAIWDGNIQHTMKPFSVHTGPNYRITLQCHIAIIGNKGYIFW